MSARKPKRGAARKGTSTVYITRNVYSNGISEGDVEISTRRPKLERRTARVDNSDPARRWVHKTHLSRWVCHTELQRLFPGLIVPPGEMVKLDIKFTLPRSRS